MPARLGTPRAAHVRGNAGVVRTPTRRIDALLIAGLESGTVAGLRYGGVDLPVLRVGIGWFLEHG